MTKIRKRIAKIITLRKLGGNSSGLNCLNNSQQEGGLQEGSSSRRGQSSNCSFDDDDHHLHLHGDDDGDDDESHQSGIIEARSLKARGCPCSNALTSHSLR